MRIAFWNRKWNGGRQAQAAFLADWRWDLLVLAEVTRSAHRAFTDALRGSSYFTLDDPEVDVSDRRYPHGIALYARPGVDVSAFRCWPCKPDGDLRCRRERGAIAEISTTEGAFTLIGWQAPFATGKTTVEKQRNRRVKQHGYRELVAHVETADRPLVVAMDGNNWHDSLEPPMPTRMDEWRDEELFHGPNPAHELCDVLRVAVARDLVRRAAVGDGPLAVTKVTSPLSLHRMDRIYVSSDRPVIDAGVDYGGRAWDEVDDRRALALGSDHALVWAELGSPSG